MFCLGRDSFMPTKQRQDIWNSFERDRKKTFRLYLMRVGENDSICDCMIACKWWCNCRERERGRDRIFVSKQHRMKTRANFGLYFRLKLYVTVHKKNECVQYSLQFTLNCDLITEFAILKLDDVSQWKQWNSLNEY